MRKGKSAEIAKREARDAYEMWKGMLQNAKWNCAGNVGRECASFVVIPAAERESPYVCRNAKKRNCTVDVKQECSRIREENCAGMPMLQKWIAK